MNEQEILKGFYTRLNRFTESSSVQFWRKELKTNYRVMSGDQWDETLKKERERRNKPITWFNNMASIVRAISGYQIVNRNKIDYYARNRDPLKEQESDVMGDAVEYIQDDSGFFGESSLSFEDVLVSGLGATATTFNYMNPEAPHGEVCEDRIFPAFLLYDNQVRGRKLNKRAKWAGYVEVVGSEWLDKEIEELKGDTYETYSGSNDSDFLSFFTAYSDRDQVDLIYHYEWIEPETIWRVKNPFSKEVAEDPRIIEGTQKTIGQFIAEVSGAAENEFGVDLNEGSFVLSTADYKKWRESLGVLTETTGLEFEGKGMRAERNKYYKARIARGVLLDHEESWSQSGFTITYKTGYYDESNNCFYGLVRDMLPVQEALNTAVSDYESYLESVPKGGQEIEADAVADIKKYIKSRVNEQDVTVYESGGLAKSRPKQIPQMASGLTDFIQLCRGQLFQVVGLDPNFLGGVQSGNMTDALFTSTLKQNYMVLAPIMDSDREYMRRKGRLFADSVFILSENNNGMLLRRLSANRTEDAYISLSEDNLGTEYDIVVAERPMTDEERRENFKMMIELVKFAPQALPLAIEDSPIEQERKDELLEMMKPPPPPQPDPLQQGLLKSQAAYQFAEAANKQADADKKNAETQNIQTQSQFMQSTTIAELQETLSKTQLNEARAKKELADIAGKVTERFDRMEERMMNFLMEKNNDGTSARV